MSDVQNKRIPVGYLALVKKYNLRCIPHYRDSYITMRGRGSVEINNHHETHIYPKNYMPSNLNDYAQIEFAIKYDGINLEILKACFTTMNKSTLQQHIIQHPTSKYSRVVWYLYEWLTDDQLDIPDATKGNYVEILDSKKFYTCDGTKSKRHRIVNNLVGVKTFCPIIRKTKLLQDFESKKIDQKAKDLVASYNPRIVSRAANYLFSKETISSYAIERETPSKSRESKYVDLLRTANSISNLTKEKLIELQKATVDPRFANNDYRHEQNYVGETINPYDQKIHYVSPKPEDVNSLMEGLLATLTKMMSSKIHPVIMSASIAFGFVFIHPFDDGNGRLHRFIIHYVLSRSGFTPLKTIFPISAVMLDNMREYDFILESFSIPLLKLIDYTLTNEGVLTVETESKQHYQFIDFTQFSEYLFNCVVNTVENDFKNELEFLSHYDETKKAIQQYIDMPDKLIDLLIKFTYQNHGNIPKSKRNKFFSQLTDEEIDNLIVLVREHMNIQKPEE